MTDDTQDQRLTDALVTIEVLSDWRYCPGCGRDRDWSGDTAPGAPCMGCDRYPAARSVRDDPTLRARIEALAEEFDGEVDWSAGRNNYGDNEAYTACARRLRAVLAEHAPADDPTRQAAAPEATTVTEWRSLYACGISQGASTAAEATAQCDGPGDVAQFRRRTTYADDVTGWADADRLAATPEDGPTVGDNTVGELPTRPRSDDQGPAGA